MQRFKLLKTVSTLLAVLAMSAPAFALNGGTNISVQNGTIAITGQVAVANGGTGQATLTSHGVVMGEGTSAVGISAAGTSGQAFLSGGASADGAYGTLDISTSAVTGTLPIARGGTNATSLTGSRCLRFDGTSIVSASADCATPVTPTLGFGSGMDITTSQTLFASFETGLDSTEAIVQLPMSAHTIKNLRCVNAAVAGTGNNITITGRVGACGSQADGSLTCTITGTTGANTSCNDTTNNIAPTAGQCADFKLVTPAALTANARVNCSVEITA